MAKILFRISQSIDKLNRFIGEKIAWLSLALVLVFCYDVFMRYFLDSSSASTFELEWHIFSFLFLLSAGYTFLNDGHVRVDVFYDRLGAQSKAYINILGVLFFLFPFAGILLWQGGIFAYNAFVWGEVSGDPGGLPFRFLVKSAIPLSMLLLILQGISLLIQSFFVILKFPYAESASAT
ncbi:MAG: TRAP transporter small permease subunit [Bernardetiaceae bacterium]|nr:TRAP transporter small permease subunit [Bernardetiaceae bacterium]